MKICFIILDADDEDLEERRAITYQMSKNKGLQPKRKKEQRNPRVKHRKKFEKAKVRRKGKFKNCILFPNCSDLLRQKVVLLMEKKF